MVRLALAALVAAAVLGPGLRAGAAPISLVFSATVVEILEDTGITDGSITPGAVLTGSLSFDSAAPPFSSDPGLLHYEVASPPALSTAQIGSYAFTSAGGFVGIDVGDVAPGDDNPDAFQALAGSSSPGPIAGTLFFADFGLMLADTRGTALTSTSLDSVPFDLAAWDDPRFYLVIQSSAGAFNAHIRVDSLSQVPEPAQPELVAFGLAATAACLRRGPRAG